MAKNSMPLIFMMFAIVVVSFVAVYAVASYYGSTDWTWVAQQNASLVLVLMVFGLALFVLVSWMRRR